MNLRPYQETCIKNVLSRRDAGVRRQLISLFTGGGKTVILANLPEHMPKHSQMVVFAHRSELIEQAAEKIAKWNPSLNIAVEMADQKADGREDVVVATVQTLDSARIQKFDPKWCAFLVADECHRCLGASYQRVASHFMVNPQTTYLGVTATTQRGDGQALGQVFDEIVFQYGMLDGIKDGWLVDVFGVQLRTQTDISGVGSNNGEYDKQELANAVNTPARNEAIVRTWIEYCWPRQTVCFCVNVQHTKDLCAVFVRNGVKAEAVWGTDPDRKKKLARFRAGELDILLNCQLYIEGFDMWQVECVILAAPTRAQGKLIQCMGRGTRIEEGVENQRFATEDQKQNLLVLDCVDNTTRHSAITLPSLFGLSPELDMRGQSVTTVLKQIESQQLLHPNVDMSALKDIANLKTYVREADLWTVRFAAETSEFSELQWSKRGDGSYRLLLPKGESFVIREDMVGHYEVRGTVNGVVYKSENFANLGEAVGFAELGIMQNGKDIVTLLRKSAPWMKGDVTSKQRELLYKFRVPEEQIAKMNRGSAQQWLAQRFAAK
jgi:ATP-dependent helicase IRC3